MININIKQMPAFKKAYKKLHDQDKLKVNTTIRDIVQNPKLDEEKKGDLAGVCVYKFKIHHQEMLLAYEWNPQDRLLLALGVHENYRNLKKTK